MRLSLVVLLGLSLIAALAIAAWITLPRIAPVWVIRHSPWVEPVMRAACVHPVETLPEATRRIQSWGAACIPGLFACARSTNTAVRDQALAFLEDDPPEGEDSYAAMHARLADPDLDVQRIAARGVSKLWAEGYGGPLSAASAESERSRFHPFAGVSVSPSPPQKASTVEVDDNDPLGLPVSTRALQILHKQWFTVGYDNARREPAWTSYRLSGPIRFHGHEHRPQRFATDPAVQIPALHDDYTGSGYDRGHMTPAFAMWSRNGEDAMRATFTTSNIVPQAHAMNAGVWEDIETLIAGRDGVSGGWAETYGDVWVTDGPVHHDDEPTIPGGEPVPSACWMVVLRREGTGWTSLSFEVPNDAEPREPARFLVPLSQAERDAGLELVPALTEPERAKLETNRATAVW